MHPVSMVTRNTNNAADNPFQSDGRGRMPRQQRSSLAQTGTTQMGTCHSTLSPLLPCALLNFLILRSSVSWLQSGAHGMGHLRGAPVGGLGEGKYCTVSSVVLMARRVKKPTPSWRLRVLFLSGSTRGLISWLE